MRQIARIAASVVAAASVVLFAVSCDDDDDDGILGPGTGPRVWTAVAFSSNENPPNSSSGRGFATFVDRTTSIDWSLTLDDIDEVILSHIHGPALANANAGVIFDLFIPPAATGPLDNFTRTGTITGSAAVSLDSLRTLLNNGRAYVNIHTTPLPAGAIRGNIIRTN
ncbi:MAG TPA: CHRD domain-containing protein [Gemmatimonadaceae bacterium]|nr:CHRD domain-containing protein [Gemmatimonadaceae bacterium]